MGEAGKQRLGNDGPEGSGLKVSSLGSHPDGQVVADDLEGDLVDGFGDDGIGFAWGHPRPNRR